MSSGRGGVFACGGWGLVGGGGDGGVCGNAGLLAGIWGGARGVTVL